MHLRERLKLLMLAEGPLTAAAAARKLEVRLEEIRYYLKAPEYRIVRQEASVGKRVRVAADGCGLVRSRKRARPKGNPGTALMPVWVVVVGLCDCGAPAWFEMRAMAVAVGRGGEPDEMMCTVLLCHECAKANAGKMGVRLAPRWPVAEG